MYVIYSKEGCINCQRAKALLIAKGIEFEMKMVDEDVMLLDWLRSLGVRQLPFIQFVSEDKVTGWNVGGLEELKKELF